MMIDNGGSFTGAPQFYFSTLSKGRHRTYRWRRRAGAAIGVEPTMNQQEQSDQQHGRNASRKPYQKPSFRQEKVFETMALACGKMSSTQASCHHNRKSS